jgi:hypothetical protein
MSLQVVKANLIRDVPCAMSFLPQMIYNSYVEKVVVYLSKKETNLKV